MHEIDAKAVSAANSDFGTRPLDARPFDILAHRFLLKTILMTTYIELCAGLGGMRVGLDLEGWSCLYASDKDDYAVRAHAHGVGNIFCADVTELDATALPKHDVLVAGFPCQPFSTSGPKLGFSHESGNVFAAIHRVADVMRPKHILLENVTGLLSHKKGHTFKIILQSLASIQYRAEWTVLDSAWLGVPQTRPRLFILATDQTRISHAGPHDLTLMTIVERLKNTTPLFADSIDDDESFRPAARELDDDAIRHEWASNGFFIDTRVSQWDGIDLPPSCGRTALGSAIAPNFSKPEAIKPVRFYARGKPTYLYTRDIPVGYCLGNIPGGAPLFAVELASISNADQRGRLLEFTNWSRDQDGHVVFRVTPERALRLFGDHYEKLEKGLAAPQLTLTKKYQLVGNMVAPVVAQRIAAAINKTRAKAALDNPNAKAAIA